MKRHLLRCSDVEGVECDFVARGDTEDDVLRQTAEHARTAHDRVELSQQTFERARSAIESVEDEEPGRGDPTP